MMDVTAKYIARQTLDEQSTDHRRCLEIDLGNLFGSFPISPRTLLLQA
jgi:hypothetical protein